MGCAPTLFDLEVDLAVVDGGSEEDQAFPMEGDPGAGQLGRPYGGPMWGLMPRLVMSQCFGLPGRGYWPVDSC